MGTLALIPGLILATVAATASDDAVRREVADVYRDRAYQMMPRDAGPPPTAEPEETAYSGNWPGRSGGSGGVDLPGSGGDLLSLVSFLGWSLAIAALVLVALWLVTEWSPFCPGGSMAHRRRVAKAPGGAAVRNIPVVAETRP